MHGTIPRRRRVAIKHDGRDATERIVDGKSAVDDGDWFKRAAQQLYPHKPGTILHLTTGLGDERLCQRYAAGDVRPPAYFLRALLRSQHGEQWLAAALEGCTATWWKDLQRARRVAVALRE